MQITLVETEIKQALIEYLGRQMKVADGMEMIIDLSATRGAEGFKANINIQPVAQITSIQPSAFTPPVFVPKATVVESTIKQAVVHSTARTPEPGVVEDEAPFEAASVAEAPAEAGNLSDTSQSPDSENVQPAQDQAGNGEAPAASPRSLFGNLKKPKN